VGLREEIISNTRCTGKMEFAVLLSPLKFPIRTKHFALRRLRSQFQSSDTTAHGSCVAQQMATYCRYERISKNTQRTEWPWEIRSHRIPSYVLGTGRRPSIDPEISKTLVDSCHVPTTRWLLQVTRTMRRVTHGLRSASSSGQENPCFVACHKLTAQVHMVRRAPFFSNDKNPHFIRNGLLCALRRIQK
jgi:hypothetical protein